MANVTFKKSLILFVLALILSFSSFAQKKGKLKEFSKEFPVFITELDDFMTASDNSELKSTFKALKIIKKMNCKKVLIHDVARPIPSKKLINKIIYRNIYINKYLINN